MDAIQRVATRLIHGRIDESSPSPRPVAEARPEPAGLDRHLNDELARMVGASLPSAAKAARRETARLAAEAGKKATREAATEAATRGARARAASAAARHLFREAGEGGARMLVKQASPRALEDITRGLNARVRAHVLEHTREILEKPKHTVFDKSLDVQRIGALMRETAESGTRPLLSEMSESGALAFVIEKEFPEAIGTKGEKFLRLVVDAKGNVVTAFPADKALPRLSVKGLQVSGALAATVFVAGVLESEAGPAADDARARTAKAGERTWYEKGLEWFGPWDVLGSSNVAIEPNHAKIAERTRAALDEARASFGRDPSPDESAAIRAAVYQTWAEAAYAA